MSRLIVGNISNTKMPTKKPTSALKYDAKGVISFFFNRFFKFFKISNICGGTQVLEIVIFQPSLTDFDQNKDDFVI